MTDSDDNSAERKAINEAREAAAKSLQETMLRSYLQILMSPSAGEQHWFGPLIEWAVKFFGEDPLLDSFAVSRAALLRWIAGENTPGSLARASLIDRLIQRVENTIRDLER